MAYIRVKRKNLELKRRAKFWNNVRIAQEHYKTCKQAGCTFGRGYYIQETSDATPRPRLSGHALPHLSQQHHL